MFFFYFLDFSIQKIFYNALKIIKIVKVQVNDCKVNTYYKDSLTFHMNNQTGLPIWTEWKVKVVYVEFVVPSSMFLHSSMGKV